MNSYEIYQFTYIDKPSRCKFEVRARTLKVANEIINIENTGVSIPENEFENIFAKFYRLDKSGDRTKKSYGLGLSIVKRILDLHNSSYSITNSTEGVLFKFSLPKSLDIEE